MAKFEFENEPFTFKALEDALVAFNHQHPEHRDKIIFAVEMFDMGAQLGVGFYDGEKRNAVRMHNPNAKAK